MWQINCFEYDLQEWFDFKIPKTKVAKDYIEHCLHDEKSITTKPNTKLIWLASAAKIKNTKKGKVEIILHTQIESSQVTLEKHKGEWLMKMIGRMALMEKNIMTYADIKNDYEQQFEDFELFWFSKPMERLRNIGIVEI